MHGEELIECLGIDDRVLSARELQAHKRRFKSTNQEEHKTCADIHHAELFVIDGQRPARDRLPEATWLNR